MDAVTTGAICRKGGSVLGRQAMVTVEKGLNPVGGQVVLGVQPLRGVAVTANVRRDFQWRTALQSHNFVFGVTIRAGRGIPMALRDRFAVHARLDILGR